MIFFQIKTLRRYVSIYSHFEHFWCWTYRFEHPSVILSVNTYVNFLNINSKRLNTCRRVRRPFSLVCCKVITFQKQSGFFGPPCIKPMYRPSHVLVHVFTCLRTYTVGSVRIKLAISPKRLNIERKLLLTARKVVYGLSIAAKMYAWDSRSSIPGHLGLAPAHLPWSRSLQCVHARSACRCRAFRRDSLKN